MTMGCVWGDVCVCVHMCVCVCVSMRAYVCVFVCLCMCVHWSAVGVLHCIWVQLCVDSLVCLLVRVSVVHQEAHVDKTRHIRTYIPVCVCVRVRSCVCECLHVCVDECVICSMFMSTGFLVSRGYASLRVYRDETLLYLMMCLSMLKCRLHPKFN